MPRRKKMLPPLPPLPTQDELAYMELTRQVTRAVLAGMNPPQELLEKVIRARKLARGGGR